MIPHGTFDGRTPIRADDIDPHEWPEALRELAAQLWPSDPFPDTVVACELITEFARVGVYDHPETEVPF